MPLTIDDLLTPSTTDQVLETFLATLETIGVPARSWRVGGAFRTILKTVATTYAGYTVVMSEFARGGFLDTARASWLTLLALHVYGVTRRPSTFATGYVLFTNTGGGVYDSSNAAAGTVYMLAGTKRYFTLEDLSLLTPGSTQLVSIQAQVPGSANSAAPTTINVLETQLIGVTISNPLSVAGSDEQDDESLRETCRNKIAALSLLGPRGAYAYAVDVALRLDGSPVDINRREVVEDPDTGTVTVYSASPAGTPLADDLTAIRLSVETWARPDSVTAVVVGATPVAFTKDLIVWAKATPGLDEETVQTAVEDALVTMIASYPIGGENKPPDLQGYLFATNIEGTAKAAHASIFAIDGVGVDLAIGVGEVATLAATVDVRLV